MSVAVWIWPGKVGGGAGMEYDEHIIDLGGGITVTALHEVPATAYDLTGQSRSRMGTAVFKVILKTEDYAGDATAVAIIRFLELRKEAANESFYFYYRPEQATIDPTGVVTVGRYLVKCLTRLDWTISQLLFHNFAELIFKEDRS